MLPLGPSEGLDPRFGNRSLDIWIQATTQKFPASSQGLSLLCIPFVCCQPPLSHLFPGAVSLHTPGLHKWGPCKHSKRGEKSGCTEAGGEEKWVFGRQGLSAFRWSKKLMTAPLCWGKARRRRSVTGNHRLYQWAATKGGRPWAASSFLFKNYSKAIFISFRRTSGTFQPFWIHASTFSSVNNWRGKAGKYYITRDWLNHSLIKLNQCITQ